MPFLNFLLSFFIEFGGLVGFLFFAWMYGFFAGVYVLIIFSLLSLLISWLRDKRLPIFSIYAAVAILFFGLLSIYYEDPYLVVLEYTLYNFVFALAAFIGFKRDKPLMQTLFPTMFMISHKGWHIMSVAWGVVFLIAGFFNEFFWHLYGEYVWLMYRGFMIVFATLVGLCLLFVSRKERLPGSNSWGMKKY